MSIKYNISHNGLRIETFPEGVLDIQATIDYFDMLNNDSQIAKDAIEIVNFNKVTDYKFSALEFDTITKSYQAPKKQLAILATIFLCESDLGYGIGRMLQTYHDITNPMHKVFVVRTEDELEEQINNLTTHSN